MLKKTLVALLAVLMIFSIVACRGGGGTDPTSPETEAPKPTVSQPAGAEPFEPSGEYKIAVYTGTVSQGEEEYQAAQKMKELYGDMIVTATYPYNISSEDEQVIQGVLQLASDDAVKAIVFVQAVPGAAAAIDKVRETRPDMLFITGVCAEPPDTMSEKAELSLLDD